MSMNPIYIFTYKLLHIVSLTLVEFLRESFVERSLNYKSIPLILFQLLHDDIQIIPMYLVKKRLTFTFMAFLNLDLVPLAMPSKFLYHQT